MAITKIAAVAEFRSLILAGLDAWVKAGQIVNQVLDDETMDVDEFAKAAGVSAEIVLRFDQIGRSELNPQLLAMDSNGARKLARCTYREQTKYIEHPVELLVGDGDTLMVNLDALTRDQCSQVFAPDHVRSLSEQRAWTESRDRKIREAAIKRAAVTEHAPYTVGKGRVVFSKGCELTRKELTSILLGMEK